MNLDKLKKQLNQKPIFFSAGLKHWTLTVCINKAVSLRTKDSRNVFWYFTSIMPRLSYEKETIDKLESYEL